MTEHDLTPPPPKDHAAAEVLPPDPARHAVAEAVPAAEPVPEPDETQSPAPVAAHDPIEPAPIVEPEIVVAPAIVEPAIVEPAIVEPAVIEPILVSPVTVEPPPPTPPSPPAPPPTAPVPQSTGGTPLWLTLLIVLILGGGLYWIYAHPPAPPAAPQPDAAPAGQEAALQALQERLTALEHRPAVAPASAPVTLAPVNLAPLEARLAAAEATLRAEQSHPGTPADIGGLATRIAALEQRPAGAAPDLAGPIASATAPLSARLDAVDTKLQAIIAQDSGSAIAKLATRLDAIEAKLQQIASLETTRAETAARLRAAATALQLGQKLGDLPGAPPALARFAQSAPPTEASLRLSFAAAADAAEAASQPSTAGLDAVHRMWQRITSLVTIRQGDQVLVGPPAAVTLNHARVLVDAGDLAGALTALAPLDPKASAAIAPWRDRVQALLEARAALATLEAHP